MKKATYKSEIYHFKNLKELKKILDSLKEEELLTEDLFFQDLASIRAIKTRTTPYACYITFE